MPGMQNYDCDQLDMESNFGLAELRISYYGMSAATIDSLRSKVHAILRERDQPSYNKSLDITTRSSNQ